VNFTKRGKIWRISLPGDGTELSLAPSYGARPPALYFAAAPSVGVSWRTASDSQKWRGINREKVNNKKGNNHAKNSEHEHFIPSDNRPEEQTD
jgi:hypothetical protein